MARWLVSTRGVVTWLRVVLGLVVTGIVAMPVWEGWGIGDGVRDAFAAYCHQRFDRSFELAGAVLPVCARCTGLWVGALMAAWLVPWIRPARALPPLGLLAWAALPMALDLAGENLFGLGAHAWSRALTGLCLGAVVVAFVLPALVRAGEEIEGRCETGSSTSRA